MSEAKRMENARKQAEAEEAEIMAIMQESMRQLQVEQQQREATAKIIAAYQLLYGQDSLPDYEMVMTAAEHAGIRLLNRSELTIDWCLEAVTRS